MSIEVDDSGEQTAIVIDKVAETVGLNAERTVIDYEPWRNFQRWLGAGNCKVVVPFARELGRLIPPRSVRLRRDFSQILLAIKAHALIHRQHRQVDDRGQIVANVELDYLPVAKLIGGIVSEASGTAVAKEVQETINAATANVSITDGATAFEVAKLLKLASRRPGVGSRLPRARATSSILRSAGASRVAIASRKRRSWPSRCCQHPAR